MINTRALSDCVISMLSNTIGIENILTKRIELCDIIEEFESCSPTVDLTIKVRVTDSNHYGSGSVSLYSVKLKKDNFIM